MAGHRVRNLGVALVVVAGLLVSADRVGLLIAERVAADSLQTSQDLPNRPSVSVGGFPFLTQLASGSYDDVEIKATDVPVGPANLSLSELDVHLEHVTANHSFSTIRARTATADATLGYADLSDLLHVDVHPVGTGRVAATASVGALGLKVSGSVSARIVRAGNGLRFTAVRVRVAGAQSALLNHTLSGIFDRRIALSGLPFHIRLTAVSTAAQGIVLRFIGRQLVYRS